jgi:transcriptional regulator with XRE-family HTH domain
MSYIYQPEVAMNNEIGKRIGRRIRIRRAVLDMSQAELAQALGITQAYLSYMERGARTIDAAMLTKIAAVLKCKTTDLMSENPRLLAS